MSHAEFAQQLLAAARGVNIASNPFVRGVREGIYPRAALRAYAVDLAVGAGKFPQTLAAILSCCDRPEVRRALLVNILEEEGVVTYQHGAGLAVDAERGHVGLAWRFARAAGATDADACADAGRHIRGLGWITEELRAGRWIGPLAYATVGGEVNVPEAFRALAFGLRTHYGFAEHEVEYFTEHITADERHGEKGAAVLAAAAETSEARREALAGVRRGALSFWQCHKRHDRAARLCRKNA